MSEEEQRPANPLPAWATDDLYDDPGEPWDNAPTKVEPAALQAQGWKPSETPTGDHLGWLFNKLCVWVEHLSRLQVQNWFPPATMNDQCRAVCWGPAVTKVAGDASGYRAGVWIGVGDTGHVEESADGYTWANDAHGVGSPPSFRAVAAHDSSDAFIAGGSTSKVLEKIAGVWTSHTVPGGEGYEINCIRYWKEKTLWILGGNVDSGSDDARLWTTPDGVTYTQRTLPNANGGGRIEKNLLATSAGVAVAVARHPSPATAERMWRSTDGVTWTEVTHSISDPVAITYSYIEGKFMIMTDAGLVYTSPDGTTWTNVGDTGAEMGPCLANNGSVWLGIDQNGSGVGREVLFYSVDTGVHWYGINLSVLNLAIEDIQFGHGRFMVIASDGSNQKAVQSLRIDRSETVRSA